MAYTNTVTSQKQMGTLHVGDAFDDNPPQVSPPFRTKRLSDLFDLAEVRSDHCHRVLALRTPVRSRPPVEQLRYTIHNFLYFRYVVVRRAIVRLLLSTLNKTIL